ncbi:MAG: hypothetical protein J6J44_01825 [Lachnospiraceae bacterium]|nr:hypothetical protein [Lachnospiraceae bacterium]
MKKIYNIFIVLAILLSDVMCAVVAYNFGILYLGGKYGMYSAPTWVAFLYGIPFVIGIVVCVIVAVVIKKRTVK